MDTKKNLAWNAQAANTPEQLADILLSAANGIKTQALASPVLGEPSQAALKNRLSEIADELHGLQQDVFAA